MKKISTRTHGMIDYGTAVGLLAIPRLLRMNPFVTKMLTGSAVVTALYSMLTNYELGIFKILPMKVHLGLDAAQSAALASAPIAFARGNRSALPMLLAISLFEAAVTLNSQTRPKRKFLGFRF